MTNRRVLDPSDIILIAFLCILTALGGIYIDAPIPEGNFGLYLPSPNLWPIENLQGSILSVILIFISAFCVYFFNKHFSIIKTAQPIWASIFLPLCCGNLMLTGSFSQSTPCFLLIFCAIWFLLSSYKEPNATRKIFSATTFLSVGSLFEYSFVIFIPALFIGMAEMKVFRIREITAGILGLLTPYWIAFGLGLLNPLNINIPLPKPLFMQEIPANMFVVTLVSGILLLTALLLTLNNGIKLYAGNAQLRNYVNIINIFGISAAAGMILDFSNIMAYMMIFNLWVTLQLGIIHTIWNMKKGYILFRVVEALIFICSIAMGISILSLPFINS